MEIRVPNINEAEIISDLIINSIKKSNEKYYNHIQIEVMISRYFSDKIENFIKKNNRNIFVLIDKNEIVGFLWIILENNFIDSLYVKSEKQGKGYGKRLLDFAQEFAKQNNLKFLKLFSSLSAVDFYKSQGFKIIRKFNNTASGLKIMPFLEMTKYLI